MKQVAQSTRRSESCFKSNSFPTTILVFRLLTEKKSPNRQRSQSVLSCRSLSSGVLLTEITVQRTTYVINGEDDDTRSARW